MRRIADPPGRVAGLLGLACGVLAPLVYAATVIWGAGLVPGYSHVSDFISALTQAGRAGTGPVTLLFALYNGLVLGFALTGLRIARGQPEWSTSFILLFATGMFGILMLPFPQDPVGAPATLAGSVHIALAGLAALGSMGAIGFAALAWRRARKGEDLALFSAACFILVLGSGLFGAAGAIGNWVVAGLLERVTIGFFLLWMLVTASVWVLRADAWSHPVAGDTGTD